MSIWAGLGDAALLLAPLADASSVLRRCATPSLKLALSASTEGADAPLSRWLCGVGCPMPSPTGLPTLSGVSDPGGVMLPPSDAGVMPGDVITDMGDREAARGLCCTCAPCCTLALPGGAALVAVPELGPGLG